MMMRYLNGYKIFEDKNDIDSICERYGITNYTINSDGSIDVDGDVNVYHRVLTKLPIKFGKVSGAFHCGTNQLTGLEGAPPSEVGGHFTSNNNLITSLEHCPRRVVGYFSCSYIPNSPHVFIKTFFQK